MRKKIIHIGETAVITPEQIEAAICGDLQIYRQPKQRLRLYLSLAERKLFKIARDKGFLWFQKTSQPLIEAWYAWCRAASKPCLIIQIRKRTAKIVLDMSTAAVNLSDHERNRIEHLFFRNSVRQSHGTTRDNLDFQCGETYCVSKGIEINQAENLAGEILTLTQLAMLGE